MLLNPRAYPKALSSHGIRERLRSMPFTVVPNMWRLLFLNLRVLLGCYLLSMLVLISDEKEGVAGGLHSH